MTHTGQPILDVPYHPTPSIGLASAEDRITDRYHSLDFCGGCLAEVFAMGAQVRRVMATGELVGDDLVESVVRDRLTQHAWNFGFIIDGLPRDRGAGRVLPGELRHRRRHRA